MTQEATDRLPVADFKLAVQSMRVLMIVLLGMYHTDRPGPIFC